MVDAWLSRFVLSHDMVRIEIDSQETRAYVLAYLKSRMGQQLLRRDKTGSVIDHLTDRHIADQEVPFPADDVVDAIATKMNKAIAMREKARLDLAAEIDRFSAELPRLPRAERFRTWTFRARKLEGRVDAAYYEPAIATVRRKLL
jgi:hypothetical protein